MIFSDEQIPYAFNNPERFLYKTQRTAPVEASTLLLDSLVQREQQRLSRCESLADFSGGIFTIRGLFRMSILVSLPPMTSEHAEHHDDCQQEVFREFQSASPFSRLNQ